LARWIPPGPEVAKQFPLTCRAPRRLACWQGTAQTGGIRGQPPRDRTPASAAALITYRVPRRDHLPFGASTEGLMLLWPRVRGMAAAAERLQHSTRTVVGGFATAAVRVGIPFRQRPRRRSDLLVASRDWVQPVAVGLHKGLCRACHVHVANRGPVSEHLQWAAAMSAWWRRIRSG
jgi:hypothetical protein